MFTLPMISFIFTELYRYCPTFNLSANYLYLALDNKPCNISTAYLIKFYAFRKELSLKVYFY